VLFDLLVRRELVLADIRTIATHPHAEAQVRRFLLRISPQPRWRWSARRPVVRRPVSNGEYDAAVAHRWRASFSGWPRSRMTSPTIEAPSTASCLLSEPVAAAAADRQRPDDVSHLPTRGSCRRVAGDPDRVQHPRRQPDPHRVPSDQGPAGTILFHDRLRGSHRRGASRRSRRRAAPGSARCPLPRSYRRRDGEQGAIPPGGRTPSSGMPEPGWPGSRVRPVRRQLTRSS